MLYLRAVLKDGQEFVSQFTKLQGAGRYASDVMAGRKAFNIWKITGTAHPVTGEQVLMRTRGLLAGNEIRLLEQVRPMSAEEFGGTQDALDRAVDALTPTAFVAAEEPKSAGYGIYTVLVEVTVAGVVLPAGTKLPVHRDSSWSGEKFVIVKPDAGEEGRYYFARVETLPGDGDDADGATDDFGSDTDDIDG